VSVKYVRTVLSISRQEARTNATHCVSVKSPCDGRIGGVKLGLPSAADGSQ